MGADMQPRIAVIAGAGPAGLTAALELLRRSDFTPIVFEADKQVGGISKTVNYRGNRMDLGGHRFFSKSDWVMRWWQEILPLAPGQMDAGDRLRLTYQQRSRDLHVANHGANSSDSVLLIRRRLSRIFYNRRYFDYPLKLSAGTLHKLGAVESLRIGLSYARAQMTRRLPESTLEDFLINRFGDRLYRTFFKDYTEKVWGVCCREISAEWGAQRIKGLSVSKALTNALISPFRGVTDTSQKGVETSLIERFLYPKFGPGQMWEEVARRITTQGGSVHLAHRIVGLEHDGAAVKAVAVRDGLSGTVRRLRCDQFISTMPVRDLIEFLNPADATVKRIADQLPYRDFMTAGLLLRKMRSGLRASSPQPKNGMPPDNWIYIQEPGVRAGRLQIFNNWSPSLVADPDTIWVGLEYFCAENDDLWAMDDEAFLAFAAAELEGMGLIEHADVLDGTVVRVPKAYPAYFGGYRDFAKIRAYLERFSNLYPIGRNGMHRYNNQDHSMLAANGAVESIINGGGGKSEIWRINAEDGYHEESEVHH
jgi:protoporphyrinogen oxidase